MKYNTRELFVKIAIKEIFNDIVGGFKNTLLDYPEDSEEYKNAKNFLEDKEAIKITIYKEVINTKNVATNIGLIAIQKDVRFLGKETIMELIEERINKSL